MTHFFGDGPDAPAIASRRRLAVGRTRGGSLVIQMCARFGDMQATGTREAAVITGRPKWLAEAAAKEAAGIALVAAAGRRAWDLHKATGETIVSGDQSTTSTWREHFPRGVLDPYGPSGEPIFTSTDRRMLWHIEGWLAVSAPGGGGDLRLALYRYLCETCEHHWRECGASAARHPDTGEVEDIIPAHRQCLWCSEVEWAGEIA